MKLTKLSLVAALAVSTAFAGGDIAPVEPTPMVETSPFTFGGNIKAFYDTTAVDGGQGYLFHKDNSKAQFAVDIDMAYSFADTWKVNFGATALTTLGLEGHLVEGVWLVGDNTSGGPGVGDALWIDTFNVTGTMFDGKLTTVLGRQMLDTPLAFSETWSIAPNTFDAAVAIFKPIEQLSLIAGYVYDGNGNAYNTSSTPLRDVRMLSTFRSNPGGFTGDAGFFPVATGSALEISNGAVALAAVGTFAGVTAQAWYYDVLDIAQATWLQADGDFSGFQVGAQYAWIQADDVLASVVNTAHGIPSINDSSAWSGKLGYKMDAFNVWAAYSSVDKDGVIDVSNTATMFGTAGWGNPSRRAGQTKLYTEAWWNYGYVGNPGADTFAAAASYNVGDLSIFNGIELLAQYTSVSGARNTINYALSLDNTGANGIAQTQTDMDELTLLVGTKMYGLDVQLAYIWADYTTTDTATSLDIAADTYSSNTIQAYITYSF